MEGDKMVETQKEGDNEVIVTRSISGDQLVSVGICSFFFFRKLVPVGTSDLLTSVHQSNLYQ